MNYLSDLIDILDDDANVRLTDSTIDTSFGKVYVASTISLFG